MCMNNLSTSRVHCSVSNKGVDIRLLMTFSRSCINSCWPAGDPSRTAISSYCSAVWHMSSGHSKAVRRLAQTRLAMCCKGRVTIGTPAHRTSQELVCPLYWSVSSTRSAHAINRMYSSFSKATGVKIRRSGLIPYFSSAVLRRMASPAGGNCRSHKTELAVRFRMEAHTWNMLASILYNWLKQAKTNLSVGNPRDSRVASSLESKCGG
mmetsp:Transcript_67225/g.112800  ORF Transcript_67225/g.112800 Transcript_67225/m.112800 type:complete len:208 (+) Transcript_67225:2885-3508(+)